jgi:hypothetical protein
MHFVLYPNLQITFVFYVNNGYTEVTYWPTV